MFRPRRRRPMSYLNSGTASTFNPNLKKLVRALLLFVGVSSYELKSQYKLSPFVGDFKLTWLVPMSTDMVYQITTRCEVTERSLIFTQNMETEGRPVGCRRLVVLFCNNNSKIVWLPSVLLERFKSFQLSQGS